MPNPKFDAKETKMYGILNCNVCRYHPSKLSFDNVWLSNAAIKSCLEVKTGKWSSTWCDNLSRASHICAIISKEWFKLQFKPLKSHL